MYVGPCVRALWKKSAPRSSIVCTFLLSLPDLSTQSPRTHPQQQGRVRTFRLTLFGEPRRVLGDSRRRVSSVREDRQPARSEPHTHEKSARVADAQRRRPRGNQLPDQGRTHAALSRDGLAGSPAYLSASATFTLVLACAGGPSSGAVWKQFFCFL